MCVREWVCLCVCMYVRVLVRVNVCMIGWVFRWMSLCVLMFVVCKHFCLFQKSLHLPVAALVIFTSSLVTEKCLKIPTNLFSLANPML
jgi:hypothetical protein